MPSAIRSAPRDRCSVFTGSTPAYSQCTAIKIHVSIDDASSLIVTGNDNTDKATVSFADHTYAVRGEPGGNEVLVGDHGSDRAHDAKVNAVSCRGPIDSIRTSLGGGDDALYGMGDFDGCDGGAATNQLANWGPRYRTNDAR